MAEKLLDIAEFAGKVHYSERRIRQLCIDGKIPGARKLTSGSRKWLIPESALQKFPEGTGQALQKENILSDEKNKSLEVIPNEIEVRIQRILTLKQAYDWSLAEFRIEDPIEPDDYLTLPAEQGNFRVHIITAKSGRPRFDGETGALSDLGELWYVAVSEGEINLQIAISDISVLMHRCSNCALKVIFIIATSKDLASERDNLYHQFEKLRSVIDGEQGPFSESSFCLEIWDQKGLLEKEKQLRLRFDL